MPNKAIAKFNFLTPTRSGFSGSVSIRYGPEQFPRSRSDRILEFDITAINWEELVLSMKDLISRDAANTSYQLNMADVFVEVFQ